MGTLIVNGLKRNKNENLQQLDTENKVVVQWCSVKYLLSRFQKNICDSPLFKKFACWKLFCRRPVKTASVDKYCSHHI